MKARSGVLKVETVTQHLLAAEMKLNEEKENLTKSTNLRLRYLPLPEMSKQRRVQDLLIMWLQQVIMVLVQRLSQL